MTENETIELLVMIQAAYQQRFKVDDQKETLRVWHWALKDYEFSKVEKNFKAYLTNSTFPPTIADLVKEPKNERIGPYIPGHEETQAMFAEMEEKSKLAAKDPDRFKAMEEGRKFAQSLKKRVKQPWKD